MERPPTPMATTLCSASYAPMQSFYVQGALGHRYIIPVAKEGSTKYRGRLRVCQQQICC